jgi:hypothetical protein
MIIFGDLMLNQFNMTKKDFFRIIIKLFGLYWFISSLFSAGQFYYLFFTSVLTVTSLLMTLLLFLVVLVMLYMLIVKTDFLIDFLKLNSGFDEDRIEFENFGLDNILKLGIITIGGMLILDNIALFLNQLYLSLKIHMTYVSSIINLNGYSIYYWAVSFAKIILGYLLLTNYPAISKFLLKITQKKEEIQ